MPSSTEEPEASRPVVIWHSGMIRFSVREWSELGYFYVPKTLICKFSPKIASVLENKRIDFPYDLGSLQIHRSPEDMWTIFIPPIMPHSLFSFLFNFLEDGQGALDKDIQFIFGLSSLARLLYMPLVENQAIATLKNAMLSEKRHLDFNNYGSFRSPALTNLIVDYLAFDDPVNPIIDRLPQELYLRILNTRQRYYRFLLAIGRAARKKALQNETTYIVNPESGWPEMMDWWGHEADFFGLKVSARVQREASRSEVGRDLSPPPPYSII